MPIRNLDHVYVETAHWEESAAFWRGLGFEFAEQWGTEGHRAGRLIAGGASVVLAEVPPGDEPQFNAFFGLDDSAAFEMGPGVEIETALEETHWGTKWIRVTDPDGRVFALEDTSGQG